MWLPFKVRRNLLACLGITGLCRAMAFEEIKPHECSLKWESKCLRGCVHMFVCLSNLHYSAFNLSLGLFGNCKNCGWVVCVCVCACNEATHQSVQSWGLSLQIYRHTLILRVVRLAVPEWDSGGGCFSKGECLSGAFTKNFFSCSWHLAVQMPHICYLVHHQQAPVNPHVCFRPLSPVLLLSFLSHCYDWQLTCRQQLASPCVLSSAPCGMLLPP